MNDIAADQAAAAFESDLRTIAMGFLVMTKPAATIREWIRAGTFPDRIAETAAALAAKLDADDFSKLCDALSTAFEPTPST